MRIAVIGLGRMGYAVTERLLQKGHDVMVWNRTRGREAGLVDQGAVVADSPSEAVSRAEVVITLLSDDAAVEQVCLGASGLIARLPDGAALAEMSTIHPDTSRALAQVMPEEWFIDAPVLGSPMEIAAGDATLLLSGSEPMIRALDPLWHDFGAGYMYCGPVGVASLLKLLSNMMFMGSTGFMIEAILAAQANGVDNDMLRRFLGDSPALSAGVRARLEDMLGGDHEGLWSIALAEKDMRLALDVAVSAGVEAPLGSAMEGILARTAIAGYGAKDLGAIIEAMRPRIPGTEHSPPPVGVDTEPPTRT